MTTLIPGLPPHLWKVPAAPSSMDDVNGDRLRDEWRSWARQVLLDTNDYQRTLEGDDEAITDELILCAADPAYWLTRWGYVYEPRDKGGRGGEQPFLPFAIQVDLLRFFDACLQADGAEADGVVSKSRDMGASWLMCAFALWGWLFKSPWQVRLVSRKEDLVDAKNPDSLFWKIDYLLDRLPAFMVPAGFDRKRHRLKLHLENPANGNVIAGESTSAKSVRGGRATWVGYDEFAFMPDGDAAWSSGANSTDHRFAVSTESFDEGRTFYNLRTGNDLDAKPALFEMDWWTHPYHDLIWYGEMRDRYSADPEAFWREIGRDPFRGTSTFVYPAAHDKKVDPEVVYTPLVGELYGGMDPGFSDKCALVWMQYDPLVGGYKVLDAYQNRGLPADYYSSVINGEFETGEWKYDDEAMRIMAWTARLGRVTWYGDAYGHNVTGATTDSVYSRMATKGIHVNRDRLTDSELSPHRRMARTPRGRQEALKEQLPRMTFAETRGARLMLKALQEHVFEKDDGGRVSEAKTPKHDWTSHLVSALEYAVVNRKMRQNAAMREYAQPTSTRLMQGPKSLARWAGGVASNLGKTGS